MARDFSRWQHHRRKELPGEEAAWEQSFGVITDNRMHMLERFRKAWSFRIRYWFRRKFVWRA
jgi:hypothetical protein